MSAPAKETYYEVRWKDGRGTGFRVRFGWTDGKYGEAKVRAEELYDMLRHNDPAIRATYGGVSPVQSPALYRALILPVEWT